MTVIHGHTKITLTDVKGNKEVIEKDNIITNLVSNVLGSDFYGTLDYNVLLPMLKNFSGCSLFNSPVTDADADTVVIPKGATVVAHAGDRAYSGEDITAGTPNLVESGYITNGYKWVWDWATSAGNGIINAVSLQRGDCGRGSRNEVDADTPFMVNISGDTSNVPAGNSIMFKCALFDWEGNRAFEIIREGTKITVNVFGFCGGTSGLFDTMAYDADKVIKTYEFTLTSTPPSFWSVQYGDNKIILAWTKNATSAQYDVIDLAANTLTERTCVFSGVRFKTSWYDNYSQYGWRVNLLPVVGNYIYIPSSDNINCYKCSLVNAADVAQLPTRLKEIPWLFSSNRNAECNSWSYGAVILENDNLIFNSCAIINDTVIPTYGWMNQFGTSDYGRIFGGGHRLKKGVYLVTTNARSADTKHAYIALSNDSISTINILRTPVNKDSSKTMKLEYSITMEE